MGNNIVGVVCSFSWGVIFVFSQLSGIYKKVACAKPTRVQFNRHWGQFSLLVLVPSLVQDSSLPPARVVHAADK